MSKIEEFLPFGPTLEQTKALKKLKSFFKDNNHVFILRGYAGTGKTSILKAAVEYLKSQKHPFELWASTGRAAQILKEKTGNDTGTIHSSIYLLDEKKTKIEGKDRCLAFKLKNNLSAENTICFIDEASMIADKENNNNNLLFEDGRLLKHLFTYLGNRKVVFIGDTAQLPPINTKESAALDEEYLTNNYQKNCMMVELKQVMRQADDGVLELATSLRTGLQKNPLPPLRIQTNGLKNIDTLRDNFKMVDKYLAIHHQDRIFQNVFISLSNGAVNFINSLVRGKMFKGANLSLQLNELLLVNHNNYLHNLSNGQHILVKNCKEVRKPIYGNRFYELEIEVPGEEKTQNVYIFKDLLYSKQPFFPKENEDELIKGFAMKMQYMKIKSKSKKYLEHFKKDPFINALRCRFGYCITCHKAQGGEWKNVFLNIEPAFDHLNLVNQYRWLYTAVTRSSQNLYINQSKYNSVSI